MAEAENKQYTNEFWEKKLAGKIFVKDSTNTTTVEKDIVRPEDVPKNHRVLPPGAPQTRDYNPERLNVFVDKDFVIKKVYYS